MKVTDISIWALAYRGSLKTAALIHTVEMQRGSIASLYKKTKTFLADDRVQFWIGNFSASYSLEYAYYYLLIATDASKLYYFTRRFT